jgi:hypothetical protein
MKLCLQVPKSEFILMQVEGIFSLIGLIKQFVIATVISRCLYMQDDDAVNAEAFINKASFLVSNSQHEVLNLQYKVQIINWFQG